MPMFFFSFSLLGIPARSKNNLIDSQTNLHSIQKSVIKFKSETNIHCLNSNPLSKSYLSSNLLVYVKICISALDFISFWVAVANCLFTMIVCQIIEAFLGLSRQRTLCLLKQTILMRAMNRSPNKPKYVIKPKQWTKRNSTEVRINVLSACINTSLPSNLQSESLFYESLL